MSIEQVGPWFLLIIGAVLLVSLAFIAFREKAAKSTMILLLVGGFACAGTGVYGPSFMNEHGQWMQVMLNVFNTQDPQAYEQLLAKVGDGQVPPEYESMALAMAIDRAPEGVDPKEKLDQAMAKASSAQGRRALQTAYQRVEIREQAVEALMASARPATATSAKLSTEKLQSLDAVSRQVVSKSILKMSPQQLKTRRIDPAVVSKIRATRPK